MPGLVVLASLLLLLIYSPAIGQRPAQEASTPAPKQLLSKQLFAVRGKIVSVKSHGKGLLIIAIRPAKDFAEVSVIARENDLVGRGIGSISDSELFGLLTGDAPDDETITAAELGEGDTISVIYDPQIQNRAVEIYLH